VTQPLNWRSPRHPRKGKKIVDPEESLTGLQARIILLEADKRRLQAENDELRLRLADVAPADSESDTVDEIIEKGVVVFESLPNGKHFITGNR